MKYVVVPKAAPIFESAVAAQNYLKENAQTLEKSYFIAELRQDVIIAPVTQYHLIINGVK